MPNAWRGMQNDLRAGEDTNSLRPARRARAFAPPPSSPPAPGSGEPGRPRSTVRVLMEQAMKRGGVSGTGRSPGDFAVTKQPPLQPPPTRQPPIPPPAPTRQPPIRVPTGQAPTRQPPVRYAPVDPASIPWMPDPVQVRRANFGQWFNAPGAPQPDLGESGPMYNPVLGKWTS